MTTTSKGGGVRVNGGVFVLLSACAVFAACSKTGGSATGEPTPPMKPSAVASVPSAVASVPSAVASVPSAVAASASVAAVAASAKPVASASAAASAAKPPTTTPARTKLDGKNFALDVTTPGCRADAECAVTIRLTATGDYHVNKEYPYKFVAQAAPTHAFLGKDDPNTFSKQAGDFREEGEKTATMVVRLKPKSAGEAKVSGTYKLSVCSAENCQIDAPKIEIAVPVM